ncbi:HvfC/BufC N-terminal domain-containing protein [Pelagibaculum spongiae]|uniref:Putative DNA-binding domain-containing protein n=1 Tax=Pelagibaculum spongiae TaxID=2080658 RepID=A0A2V1GZ87_9GAMM|nr:DNA-binding domain-containing protein [Pelagibaculum spongiae]PVZ72381.1 hypothetical protein DC094_05075 [Pelagibaculum spongiae]
MNNQPAAIEETANYQSQLMRAIFSGQPDQKFNAKGLAAYQRNLQANAFRALSVSYPTIIQLIGEQALKLLANQFLAEQPPLTGDWAQWGADFPQWIDQHKISQSDAYLADCAQLDWLKHQIEAQADYLLIANSFELLATEDAISGHFICNPSLTTLHSDFPIVDIYQAHLAKEITANDIAPDEVLIQSAKKKLASGAKQNILIWRKQWQVQVAEIDIEYHYWLELLQQQLSLGELLTEFDKKYPNPKYFSFQQWLPDAIEKQIIIGFNC